MKQFDPTAVDDELSLMMYEVYFLNEWMLGEGAGLRALNLSPDDDSEFVKFPHPDELQLLNTYPVVNETQLVVDYVQSRTLTPETYDALTVLEYYVGGIFSPARVKGFEEERDDYMSELPPGSPIPPKWDRARGTMPNGCMYSGILAHLVEHATIRRKIDQNEPITLVEIATITEAPQSTVNTAAARGNFPTYDIGNKKFADPEAVLPWMIEKQGYLPTIRSGEKQAQVAAPSKETYYFVPVARDGSMFLPNCISGGGFRIGEKGNEVKVSDYFDALQQLNNMPTPHWRRPNANGNPGIVAGVRFDRLTEAQILSAA